MLNRIIAGLCFLSFSSQLLAVTKPSDLVTQRCAPCHGPDLNGVGGVSQSAHFQSSQ